MKFPINITSDTEFIKINFSATLRDMRFYDFPWFWKDNQIYEVLKKVGYIERNLSIKCNFKYKTTSICLTKDYEKIFKEGGQNIVYEKNGQFLGCLMINC
jgi:hypothetical protein